MISAKAQHPAEDMRYYVNQYLNPSSSSSFSCSTSTSFVGARSKTNALDVKIG
jgi:hypothetical protein